MAFRYSVIFKCNHGVLSGIPVLLRNVLFLSQAEVSQHNPIFPWMNTLIKMSLCHFFLHETMGFFILRMQHKVGEMHKWAVGR